MKIYKKIMNALAAVEKIVLVISTLLILVLTVGNVFSRKVIHRSWSFTEELVVAVFVLITLLAAALACREGELVSLTLVTDRLPKKLKKPSVILITVLSIIFSVILFKYGMDKVITQLQNGKRTFVLNWPEWIFWSFVPYRCRMHDPSLHRILSGLLLQNRQRQKVPTTAQKVT